MNRKKPLRPKLLMKNMEVAKLLGTTPRTIMNWARKLGWARYSRDWLFTEAEIEILRQHVRHGPGRPPGQA